MPRRLAVVLVAAALAALLPSGPLRASRKPSFSSSTLGVRVGVPVTDGRTAPQEISLATERAVQDWVKAVRSHTPGARDAEVALVSALSFEARQKLDRGIALFLSALQGQRVRGGGAEPRIAELAGDVTRTPGLAAFLKRAAVLHSDAAMHLESLPLKLAPRASARLSTRSPLLADQPQLVDKDGEIIGESSTNWNWPFARSLLDLLPPRPAADPFVGAWYHATAAYMLANGLYGDAFPHLARAAVLLPDDAQLLFDRGCYAEMRGLPRSQVLLTPMDLAIMRDKRVGGWTSRLTPSPAALAGIPPAEVANAEAESLFRRALRADPALVEARVRLARLLDVRERHEEAAAELDAALAASPSRLVAFYAHLFAGRAAQALDRLDDAARHYQEAAALVPTAQSAMLARSQVALRRSDVDGGLAPLRALPAPASKVAMQDDPWWLYHFGAGRDADALLRGMWSKVSR